LISIYLLKRDKFTFETFTGILFGLLMNELGMFAFRQKEDDGRGHAHMPNTVQNPVVGLGLQEAVDEKTSDGQ
jgi:hypothetical protein